MVQVYGTNSTLSNEAAEAMYKDMTKEMRCTAKVQYSVVIVNFFVVPYGLQGKTLVNFLKSHGLFDHSV